MKMEKLMGENGISIKSEIKTKLKGIALNLQIALGSILIVTILILPIHEHDIFLLLSCHL